MPEIDDDFLADLDARLSAIENRQQTQPTPWFWKNPLANKQQQNSTTSTRSAVIQEFTGLTTDFTTTDTSTVHEVMGVNVRVPYGNITVFAFSSFSVKHSIAAARFDAYLTLSDFVTTAAFALAFDTYIPSADRWQATALIRGASASDMNAFGLLRNRILRVSLFVQNVTAGTLTVGGQSPSSELPSLSCFVTGDSSR